MTLSDDAYMKLSNVTAQLGRERTKNDRLTIEHEILLEAYRKLQQDYRDLSRDFEQYKERYPDAI